MPRAAIRRLLALFAGCLLAAGLAGCGKGGGAEQESIAGPVVLAAASLQESLTEAAAAYAKEGHRSPVLSFAATSALARQVEQGAPADLFIAADEQWMDELAEQDLLVPGTRADLLTNRLVAIAPAGTVLPLGADPLAGSGRIAVADTQAVPAGRYAAAALMTIGRWDELEPRLAPAENVRAALALVERGEAERGIVYATDALATDKVVVVHIFPEAAHPPIRYPAAVLAGGGNGGGADFLAFLRSPAAQDIFRRHGFGIAAADAAE